MNLSTEKKIMNLQNRPVVAKGEREGVGWIGNLDKAKIEQSDYDNIVYPLTDLGWGLGEIIIPVLYTKKEWESMSPMPFYQNVEQDKRQLV